MPLDVDVLRPGEPVPARPAAAAERRVARRVRADWWASKLVVLGGLTIVASILAILFVIAAEILPLFRAPHAEPLAGVDTGLAPAPGAAAGVDEYREIAYAVGQRNLQFVPLRVAGTYPAIPIPGLDGAVVTAVAGDGRGRLVLGTSDGRVIPLDVTFGIEFVEGRRVLAPRHAFGAASTVDDGRRPVRALAAALTDAGPITVAHVADGELVLRAVVERKALVGESRREESMQTLRLPETAAVTAVAMDGRGDDLFVGLASGRLVRVDLRDRREPRVVEALDVTERAGTAVTRLAFLNGDRTLVVGDAGGSVSSWQVVAPEHSPVPRLARMHVFRAHGAPVVALAASRRDKGFASADAAGGVAVHYGTTGATLLTVGGTAGIRDVVFAPKADGLLAWTDGGRVAHWSLDNPHPEVTLDVLFGKVWYEGYAGPAYVWQSTGGTDDFEAKLSLTPLLYGTLKGTFYALLIAVPLSLLAALYVSEFAHPVLRARLKPVVEIMAALPSVVLGFLAGLWLAPTVERIVPGLVLLAPVTVAAILGAFLAWSLIPLRLRSHVRPGTEVLLLVPVVVLAAWLAVAAGDLVNRYLLAGDYRAWLLQALGLGYDQRNSLVVGIAMGFAVIPLVFTIAEDSLSNVPRHLRAGSLALGATRWQTALRVVLPTASPGIFSAIMIGFGRAVGETMIVLMATGNTPVMDWNIFSGFRALSANIAVELPEAPEGGTLFRVLFVAAFLLFVLTFVVNTLAEIVRLRLRRRYRYL